MPMTHGKHCPFLLQTSENGGGGAKRKRDDESGTCSVCYSLEGGNPVVCVSCGVWAHEKCYNWGKSEYGRKCDACLGYVRLHISPMYTSQVISNY